jgi:hypothetical protein
MRSLAAKAGGVMAQALADWIGERWLFCHAADASTFWFCRPWVTLAMSHSHRHPEWSAGWRLGVEQSLLYCDRLRAILLASPSTPRGDYLIRAAMSFRIPTLVLEMPLAHESLIAWRARMQQQVEATRQERPTILPLTSGRQCSLYLSPLDPATPVFPSSQALSLGIPASLPLVDRALVAMADRIIPLHVRPQGKVAQLLRRRLDDHRFPSASVLPEASLQPTNHSPTAPVPIAASSFSMPKRTAGAHHWWQPASHRSLIDSDQNVASSAKNGKSATARRLMDGVSSPCFAPILSACWLLHQSPEDWPYLTHCTRGRSAAWPDQSHIGYLHSLLLSQDDSDVLASPLLALQRILDQQRLLATNQNKRTPVATVSFSQVPLPKLLAARRFQKHLGRWDWEPYGLCLHRDYLEGIGGRRVIYGDSRTWSALPTADRPYFQLTGQSDVTLGDEGRWSWEREWRLAGDLRLASIPFQKAFVFVPTWEEACCLQTSSRFSILCLERLKPATHGDGGG